MSEKFKMDDYIDVAARIAAVRGTAEREYPEGSFQPLNHDEPFRIVTVGDTTFVAYIAAFYRTPDDHRPGVGTAWEPVPGRTPYTKNSELQNAETSAWGRALVAALAADTKRGVATSDEIRNRNAERDAVSDSQVSAGTLRGQIASVGGQMGWDRPRIEEDFAVWSQGQIIADCEDLKTLTEYLAYLNEERKRGAREHKQLVADVNNTTQAGHARKDSPDKGRVERVAKTPDDDPFYEPVPADA